LSILTKPFASLHEELGVDIATLKIRAEY